MSDTVCAEMDCDREVENSQMSKKLKAEDFGGLFSRRFDFRKNDSWSYNSEKLFQSDGWIISDFEKMKDRLNSVKNQLKDVPSEDWRHFTSSTDLAAFIVPNLRATFKPELLTQAWTKLFAILNEFPELVDCFESFNSLHLCEAPGAFITALNHYLVINKPNAKWHWLANSLEPYYEGNNLINMVIDDRLIQYTRENWDFGYDGTGDIQNLDNCEQIIRNSKTKQPIMLITADGSVNCSSDPCNQENTVAFLQTCETMTALSILSDKGSFLLKIFTAFEHNAINLLYLLNCCFDKVIVYKPCTSKSGNSEVYLVCLRFQQKRFHCDLLTLIFDQKNRTKSMLDRNSLPESFIDQIREMNTYFSIKQIEVINDNLRNFRDPNFNALSLNAIKFRVSKHFNRIYKLKKIPNSKKIVQNRTNLRLSYSIISNKNDGYFFDSDYVIKSTDFDNLLIDIVTGKKIAKIVCSKYCQNLNDLDVFFDCDHNRNVSYSVEHFEAILCFKNDYFYDNRLLFVTLIGMINDFEDNQNLILIDFIFLTRFQFGLIFLIAHCFQSVQFREHCVILRQFSTHNKSQIDVYMNKIKDQFKLFRNDDKQRTILSVLNISLLFKGIFYHKIYDYNSWVLNSINL